MNSIRKLGETLEAELVDRALRNALVLRRPTEGLYFHSDRGSQYSSQALRKPLSVIGAKQSMSGIGNCYDNATMEAFFSTTGEKHPMYTWNENAAVRSSGSIRWSWREATVSPDRNSWTSKGLSQKMNKSSGKRGMTTLVIDESSLRAVGAQLTDEALVVDLVDGRSVSVPLRRSRAMIGSRAFHFSFGKLLLPCSSRRFDEGLDYTAALGRYSFVVPEPVVRGESRILMQPRFECGITFGLRQVTSYNFRNGFGSRGVSE